MLRAAKFQGGIKLRNKYFHKVMLIFFIILVGIAGFSFAEVTDNVVIRNTGRITPEIMAESGYWRDIQDAVDLAASLGGGIVHIPAGIWNFVNVGESWTGARVIIPAGVSLFGAPTERYPNGSVVEWKTILQIPWDMPGDRSYFPPRMFSIEGNGKPDKSSRFSDIKLVGPKEFNRSAVGMFRGITVSGVANFRIDHCYFRMILEGIAVGLQTNYLSSGVISHCVFDNDYVNYTLDWSSREVGYAIAVDRTEWTTQWETPISRILGKYLNYTIFVEDCIFTKWRSCIAGNRGAHVVVRRSIFKDGLGHGEMDAHPSWNEPYAGCRAIEFYENIIYPSDFEYGVSEPIGIELYSGCGVLFNNAVYNYTYFIMASNTNWNSSFFETFWLWNNTGSFTHYWVGYGDEGVNYILDVSPDWYTPYPYPHPLTQE